MSNKIYDILAEALSEDSWKYHQNKVKNETLAKCMSVLSKSFIPVNKVNNVKEKNENDLFSVKFSNLNKKNLGLYSKVNLNDNDLIARLDQSLRKNEENDDEGGEKEQVIKTALVLPPEILAKINEFISDVKTGFSFGKSLPVFVISGKAGSGKTRVLDYIIENLGVSKQNIFRGGTRKKKNKEISVHIYSDVDEFEESVSVKDKGMVVCLKHTPKRRSFFDMESFDSLDFLDSYYSLQIKLDDMTYSQEDVANRLINEFSVKYCYLDQKNVTSKDFADKLIKITPKSVEGLFSRAKSRSELLNAPLTYDIVVGCMSSNQESKNKTDLCLITKPKKGLTDLILSDKVKDQIETIFYSAQSLNSVQYEFQKKLRGSNNRLVCLFTGLPGTGKSLCAEVLSFELKTELWTLDFSKVFDKYVGESEKHLTEIFTMAQQSKVVLRIDEADSLLSARSDSDRGWEITQKNHLLNLIENYDGILILTTNRAINLDPAFSRRIDFKVEFELPTHLEMINIIKALLYPDAPLSNTFDFNTVLSGIHPMSGGFIRSAIERCWLNIIKKGKTIIDNEDLNSALLQIQIENGIINKSKKPMGFLS